MLARENAVRNPKRTSVTAAALMIGVALVGFITVFAASAKQSFHGRSTARSRPTTWSRRRASGRDSIPLEARRSLRSSPRSRRRRARSGQAKIDGSARWSSRSTRPRRLALRSPADGRQISDLDADGIAVLDRRPPTRAGRSARRSRSSSRRPATHQFTVESIYDSQIVLPGTDIISIDGYEKNFPRPARPSRCSRTQGGRHAGNTAAVKRVIHAVPGPKLQQRAKSRPTRPKNLNQLLGLIYALLIFAVIIAFIGIANTLALSIYERRARSGCCARWA